MDPNRCYSAKPTNVKTNRPNGEPTPGPSTVSCRVALIESKASHTRSQDPAAGRSGSQSMNFGRADGRIKISPVPQTFRDLDHPDNSILAFCLYVQSRHLETHDSRPKD